MEIQILSWLCLAVGGFCIGYGLGPEIRRLILGLIGVILIITGALLI